MCDLFRPLKDLAVAGDYKQVNKALRVELGSQSSNAEAGQHSGPRLLLCSAKPASSGSALAVGRGKEADSWFHLYL